MNRSTQQALTIAALANHAAACAAALASMLALAPAARAQDDGMVFSEEEATSETPAEGTGEGTGEGEIAAEGGEGDVIGDLASSQGSDTGPTDTGPRRAETREEIYAVQRVYALRINRVELALNWGVTLNDPHVSHPSAGAVINYWWTNVLAVGVNFLWYQGLENESDLGFHVRRSTRLAVPITEYQLGANLNFTYVPLYGKFGMFNEYIFQWDAYLIGGVGMMRTRPVPVIDPAVRKFDFGWRIAFNLGIGLRVFVTKFFAVYAELRDYMFLEQLENLDVSLGANRREPGTWFASSPAFTNNVTAHVGVTLFLPFDFEYRLPK